MGRNSVKARRARVSVPTTYRIDNHRWRVLSRKFKAYNKSQRNRCWLEAHGLCRYDGVPIDYDARPGTPLAFETDHVKPRSTHPHLMYEWSNLRPSHCGCNRSRQAKDVGAQHVWVRPKF